MHRHFFEGRFHRSRHGWGGRMGRDGERREHRGRRRFGRFFEHGDLRFVVLALLEERPRHGYELMKELEDRTGGAYRPSPGVVYPTLAMLEDEGLIRPVDNPEGGRKLFEATEAGRAEVERNRPLVDAALGRMEEVSRQAGPGRPRVARAMMNLGMALKARMSRDITPEQMDRIVAMIDDTAAAVERT
jgi:DNA-binding PadR family transcriptional regulator